MPCKFASHLHNRELTMMTGSPSGSVAASALHSASAATRSSTTALPMSRCSSACKVNTFRDSGWSEPLQSHWNMMCSA